MLSTVYVNVGSGVPGYFHNPASGVTINLLGVTVIGNDNDPV